MATKRRQSVSFVCRHLVPLLDGSVAAHIGGMETRAALIARALNASKQMDRISGSRRLWQPTELVIEEIRLVILERW